MGIGPLITWKKFNKTLFLKKVKYPLIPAVLVFALSLIFESGEPKAALAFGLTTFIASSLLLEIEELFRRNKALSHPQSFTRSKTRRLGGMIVHLGVAVMGFAIAASSIFKIERDFVINPGQKFEIGRYELTLSELHEETFRNFQAVIGSIQVRLKNTEEIYATLRPERRFYPRSQEVTSEVDINMGLREDLYVALSGLGDKGEAVLKVFVNPLQLWLWVGAMVMVIGTLIVIVPEDKLETK
jgi:cytochrome c-type biogenesis protein CcmF